MQGRKHSISYGDLAAWDHLSGETGQWILCPWS